LPEKDALIAALVARIEALVARSPKLRAKLGLPPKTPDNSRPFRRRRGQSRRSHPRPRARPSAVGHIVRFMHPTARRDVFASGAKAAAPTFLRRAKPVRAYDRVEIPEISPT